MFEADEESVILEIVCGILGVSPEDMMEIGERAKRIITFDPDLEEEGEAMGRVREAVRDMSSEEAVVAGVFISGLLRCSLREQYLRAAAESEGWDLEGKGGEGGEEVGGSPAERMEE